MTSFSDIDHPPNNEPDLFGDPMVDRSLKIMFALQKQEESLATSPLKRELKTKIFVLKF
jgi:hypothetical protein